MAAGVWPTSPRSRASPGRRRPAAGGDATGATPLGCTVLVDYAHTPAGLEVVLARRADWRVRTGACWWCSGVAATAIGPSARSWVPPPHGWATWPW